MRSAEVLPFRFYLITDRLHTRGQPEQWLPRLAAAGLRAVQIREKDLTPAALYEYASALHRAVTSGASSTPDFYLNDRSDIALSLGFAGVHLREDSLPLTQHAPFLRQHLLFGVSCHSVEGVLAAERAGAAFATFGPVYETDSKTAYGPPVGLKLLEQAAGKSKLPLLALGGVTPHRVRECLEVGAAGVAAISAIWDVEEPLVALEEFRDALGGL